MKACFPLIISTLLALAGCEESRTAALYSANPKERHAVLRECASVAVPISGNRRQNCLEAGTSMTQTLEQDRTAKR